MSGPFGGSAKVITIDRSNPKVMLLGASNSLVFRTENGGESWVPLPFPRNFLGNVLTLAIDPSDARHYFAGVEATGSPLAGLYESLDAGLTWRAVPGLTGTTVGSVAIWARDPAHVVAATRRGVYQSLDRGRRWTRISPADNPELQSITYVAIDPVNPEVIYAGTTHLPWKTTDGGKSWRLIHKGMLDDSDIFSIDIDPRRTERVLISACSGIYRSDNGGLSWKRFTGIPATHRRTHVVVRDPGKPEVIYAGTTLGLFKSGNGGATWRRVNDLHVMSIALDPKDSRTLYLATSRAGVWKSSDGGETANPLNEGFVNRKVTNLVAAGRQLYLTSITDGGQPTVYRSEDQGASWSDYQEFRQLASDGRLQLFGTKISEDLLFASSEKDKRFWRSSDGGKTWSPVTLPIPKALPPKSARRPAQPVTAMSSTVAVRAFALETMGEPAVLLAGTDKGLYRSADKGLTWALVRIAGSVLPVQAIHAAPNGSGRMVIKTFYSMYITEDSGANWRMMRLPVSIPNIYDIAVSPVAGGSVLLATPNGLMISTDSAQTWHPTAIGLPNSTVASVRFHPGSRNRAYAVQFGRIFLSEDGGERWRPVATDLGERVFSRFVWFAPQVPDRLFAVTSDNGVVYLDLAGS
jgi:photosystem II stability/assembly factor-like uncharacterized protein